MNYKNILRTRIPVTWLVASLATVLVVVGAIGATNLHAALAKDKVLASPSDTGQENLQKIETILRDHEKDAQTRIEEALKVIDKIKNKDSAALSPINPLWDPWMPLTSPFTGGGWSIFQEMNRMRSNMDRLFDDTFSRMKLNAASSRTTDTLTWSPQGEFEEKKDAYVYRFDLPGVQKGEVNITVKDGQLILEGRRESRVEQTDKDKGLYRQEVQHGQFRRVTALPGDVDVCGAIESKLENGVLTVKLPKLKNGENRPSKKIEVM